jgi:hypothetical protein
MVNHVDSNPPRSPLSFVGIWQRFLPDRCQANPVGTPGGVSGIWPPSAMVLGFVSPRSFGAGDRGSAASAEPFAVLALVWPEQHRGQN